MTAAAPARERRVARRLEARGMAALGEHLARLRGTQLDARWELGSLFAVGSDGALFLCRDVWDASQPVRLAKIPLHRYDEPDLGSDAIRVRRDRLRTEAMRLKACASQYMPGYVGLLQFANPLLEALRGGEFALAEPALLMERVPGFDLAKWLGRVHASRLPREVLRSNVDHVAVVVLKALWDLHERGFLYTDIRPAKIRMCGRSSQRVRLVDAGALVPRGQETPGFPHDPAYLPPELHARFIAEGEAALEPSLHAQAVMAGRTLYEVATGIVPRAGREVDDAVFGADTVSPDVAEIIGGLCQGTFRDVFQALRTLVKRTQRGKVRRAPDPVAPAPPKPAVPELTIPMQAVDLAKFLAEARVAAHNVPVAPPPAPRPRPAPSLAPSAPSPVPAPPEPVSEPVAVETPAPSSPPPEAKRASDPGRLAPPPEPAIPTATDGPPKLRTQGSRFAMPIAPAPAKPERPSPAPRAIPKADAPSLPWKAPAAGTKSSPSVVRSALAGRAVPAPATSAPREPEPEPDVPPPEPSIDDILPVHVVPAPWYRRILRRLGL